MQLSENTNETGLIQDARWWSNTNSTSFPAKDVVRSINKWYQELFNEALMSMDGWDVQGEIATANLVANQQEYTYPTNLLKIKRMEVTYDGSTWVRVNPIDVQSISKPIATQTDVANEFSTSQPFYDSHDNSIFLFPIPTAAQTAGLKIWYEKEITEFSVPASEATDDTTEPNLAEQFHRTISMGAAYDYATKKGLPIASQLLGKIELNKSKLREFYNTRVQDREYIMRPAVVNYR